MTAHEYVFLLSKSKEYFFDLEKVKERAVTEGRVYDKAYTRYEDHDGLANFVTVNKTKRDVWSVCTNQDPIRVGGKTRHYARYPIALIRPCIEAGCPKGGWVLDPFLGSGTTAVAAKMYNRKCVGIELNEEWCKLAARRWKRKKTRGDFGL